MSKTKENLAAAFAGESQANRKYMAFAMQADKEGHRRAARLFRAAAEAETIHALSHLKAMGGIGTTEQNLKAALDGETYEFTAMYPPMIEAAKTDGDSPAERSLSYANEAEKSHAKLYQQALDGFPINRHEGLETVSAEEDIKYYLCTVCGYIHEDHAPDKCPVCGAGAKAFKNVD